jgi:phospholipid-binding lipoprotein MlaA
MALDSMAPYRHSFLNGNRLSLRTGLCLLLAFLFFLSGCASTAYTDARDPAERFNRAVFAVNEALDTAIMRPVAQGYDAVFPAPLKKGISNFFSNIEDIIIAINNLLQGKPKAAASDLGRVLINSTLGVGGFMDWASDWGLEKHDEDFGQTLGYWGASDGAYMMLPLLGPSSVRDTFGKVAHIYADPLRQVDEPTVYALTALRWIKSRAALLPADRVIENAALDKYVYLRDAYLQRRRYLVYDGNPPRLPENDE